MHEKIVFFSIFYLVKHMGCVIVGEFPHRDMFGARNALTTNQKNTTMKYITMLALTAAAFVSCQQQQQQQTPPPSDPVPPPPVEPVKK